VHFYVRWRGLPNPRHAGAQVMRDVVPLFLEADYEIVGRRPDKLRLRRGLPSSGSMDTYLYADVTIAMTDHGDHSVTEVYGVAPQVIRAALASLAD
jgi:hypothetical protein